MQLQVVGDTLYALVTATTLADAGHDVVLKLPKGRVADSLRKQQEVYVEPNLSTLLQRNKERISFVDMEQEIADDIEAIFIALEPNQLELAQQIIRQLVQYTKSILVVNQTTFPLGTSEKFAMTLPHHQLICLPDIIQEGSAIISFTSLNSFILGHQNFNGVDKIREIFRSFTRKKDNFLLMPLRDAEFAKLAISGMLATRVTFMNDLANVAEKLGVDIENIRQGVCSDSRIGNAYLYPGCGFGGSSFSRDVVTLSKTIANINAKSHFFEQILQINEAQKELLFRKLWQYYKADLAGKIVAIWGAAFKPNTDKVDNAPILKLIDALLAQGVNIKVHDPQALCNLQRYYSGVSGIKYCTDQYQAVVEADALMLITEWKNYWNPNFIKLKKLMHVPLLIDGRNIYDPSYVKQQGFIYKAVGRS